MNTTPPCLLEQLRRPGEEAAWERFVQLFTPLLCHWARRLGLDGENAEDFVRDVFAVLAEKLPQLHTGEGPGFRGWLWAIALDVFHKRGGRPDDGRASGSEQWQAASDADLAGGLGEKEYGQYLVQRALALIQPDFPPTPWRAFWEFAVGGRPADEVACELQIDVSDVYLARGRVLRRLRTHLEGLLD
jgi:RNA polymerase sigma-70 factor (ECF subfamily)